jgi:hypothetical protein
MSWNKEVKKELKRAFKDTEFTLKFGDGWLNISRPDMVNCEFYPCYNNPKLAEEILTARYRVYGKQKDIDVHIPNEIETFVAYVTDIMSDEKKRGAK